MFKNLPDPQLLNSSLHLSFHASHTVKDHLISVCQITANSICSQYFSPYGKISHNLYTNPVTGIQAVYKLHGKQKKHASSSQVPQNHTIRSIFIIFFHPVSHIPYLHYKVISLHTGENTGVSPTLAEEISL